MSLSTSFPNLINKAYSLAESYIKPQGIKILSIVGLFTLASGSLCALLSLRRTFLPFSHNLAKRYGPGSWALITGGAQGIGAAYAIELASRGFNLVLIDFNEQKLTETVTHIKAEYPQVQVKAIICDFSKSLQEGFFDSIMEKISGLDISVLVNNVGTNVMPCPVYKLPEEDVLKIITINIIPLTILTRRLIPQMLKRPERSAIINMSSIAGTFPLPWSETYSATKAYIDFFTRSIERDVNHKIDMLSVRPCAVSTPLTGNPKVGGFVISTRNITQSALSKLGTVPYTFAHWRHEIVAWGCQRSLMFTNYIIRSFYKDVLHASNYTL